jgi:hypothetical protein
MNPYFDLIIYLGIVFLGVGVEEVLSKIYFKKNGSRKNHQVIHFKISRYLFLISMPILGVLIMSFTVSLSVLEYFFLFAFMGTGLEYLVGSSYETIVGRKLLTYNEYSFKGYTSLLAIPLWGLCGSLIFLLSRAVR